MLAEKVDAAYRRREIEYPVEYALEMTVGPGRDGQRLRPRQPWPTGPTASTTPSLTVEDLRDAKLEEIRQRLLDAVGGLGRRRADRRRPSATPWARRRRWPRPSSFAQRRFDTKLSAEDFDGDVTADAA